MDLMDKLSILGEAARYDASCASSGSAREAQKGMLGNTVKGGICHSFSDDGRCVALLKVLLSNACAFNCAYCANRCGSDVPRAAFTPREVATITTEFYKRNYIEGLFLSSGVIKNADHTMEQMLEVVRLLRTEFRFFGYVHVKIIPGTSPGLIEQVGLLADRISVNVELPTSESLALLAPGKTRDNILSPMNVMHKLITQNKYEKERFPSAPAFAPSGQSTQLIVGATPDSDAKILRLSSGLYKRYRMRRVYYSAYVPVGLHPSLPPPDAKAPLLREHRLYQADFLLRFYKFDVEELLERQDNLAMDVDPKCDWALRHLDRFPVEVNTADEATLLRVPGIGQTSTARILSARKTKKLDVTDLKKIGVVLKRATYFITCSGKFYGRVEPDSPYLRYYLSEEKPDATTQQNLPLFELAALPAKTEM